MTDLQQQLAQLSPDKQKLLAQFLRKKSQHIDAYPLSSEQRRLWFLDKRGPKKAPYNLCAAFRAHGTFDLTVLQHSLCEIIRRHEVLRTIFLEVDGQPLQVITPWPDHGAASLPAVSLIDLQDIPPAEQEERVQHLARAEARRPFDLARSPLFHTTVLRLGQQEHVLLLAMHHIITDSWSVGLLFHELATLYAAFAQGRPAPLSALPIQYVDYARWQHDWYASADYVRQLAYWKQQLQNAPPILELPTDRSRPAEQSYRSATQTFHLPRALVNALKALAQREGATLFMTLLAAFNVLLYRSTGQDDILVGTPVANRRQREIEHLIGFFINTLVLRTRLDGEATFRALLAQVRDTALNAYQHQELPLDKLIEELHLARDPSYAPLVQVMLAPQHAPLGALALPGLSLYPLEIAPGTTKFDLLLTVEERPDGLSGWWEYSTDLFDTATIDRLQAQFAELLEGIVAQPECRVGRLPLLPPIERQLLLETWTTTTAPFPLDTSFPALFLAQVARTPAALAVRAPDQTLTYQVLADQARKLAAHLCAHGVGPETLVAVLADRGAGFLTAVLATFLAGGAYLPLDPRHPPARLRQVLAQSRPALVLVTPVHQANLDAVLVALDAEQRPHVARLPDLLAAPAPVVDWPVLRPNQLAYIIYTSGSTGTPKGAMVEQRGMINHLYVKIHDLALTEADTVAQTASQSFDISVWQFLAALLVGGAVVVLPDAVAHDPAALLQALFEHQVSIVELVPALLQVLLEKPTRPPLVALRWMILTGEALPPELAARWLAAYPHIPLLNAYGPTECSDDVTHAVLRAVSSVGSGGVPIGRAVANMRLYILDRLGQPVPIGVAGELWVGGVGVGRGYQYDPARTAAVFGPDPYGPAGARRYRTGDRGRWQLDGQIEFLGRIDHQVKLRGYRIELGEIEAVLRQHAAVDAAVVLVRPTPTGDARLVAYVVPTANARRPQTGDCATFSVAALHTYLAERLPEYMVPSATVVLERLPLTPNGKVDRAALPEPDWGAQTRGVVYLHHRADNVSRSLLSSTLSISTGLETLTIQPIDC